MYIYRCMYIYIGAAGAVICNPIEIVKTRVQVLIIS